MQWNDIRNRLKKTDSVLNIQKQSGIVDVKSSLELKKEVRSPHKTIRPIASMLILGLIVIIIILALIMQSRKVTQVGPEKDAGLTRQEAKNAQMFLQQIPVKSFTKEDIELFQAAADAEAQNKKNTKGSTSVEVSKTIQ